MEWNGTEQESSRWDFSTCFQLFPSLGVQLIKTTRQEYSSEPKNISQLSIIIHFQRIFAAFPRPISLLAPSLPRFFPGFFPGFFARPFFYCYEFFFYKYNFLHLFIQEIRSVMIWIRWMTPERREEPGINSNGEC